MSAKQIVKTLTSQGYTYQAQPGGRMDLLKLGRVEMGITILGAQSDHDSPARLELQARMLPRSSVPRVQAEAFLRSQGVGSDLKLIRYVNGVLEVKLAFIPVSAPRDVIEVVGRFARTCKALIQQYHSNSVSPAGDLPEGHKPADSDVLEGLSMWEMDFLEKAWRWTYEPHPVNEVVGFNELKGGGDLGWVSSTLTVDHVAIDYSVGMDQQFPYILLSADVQVSPSIDAAQLVARLNGTKPVADFDRIVELADKGRAVEWYGQPYYGKKYRCYSLASYFSVANLTVGQFRKKVEEFAAKVKKLPRE